MYSKFHQSVLIGLFSIVSKYTNYILIMLADNQLVAVVLEFFCGTNLPNYQLSPYLHRQLPNFLTLLGKSVWSVPMYVPFLG